MPEFGPEVDRPPWMAPALKEYNDDLAFAAMKSSVGKFVQLLALVESTSKFQSG